MMSVFVRYANLVKNVFLVEDNCPMTDAGVHNLKIYPKSLDAASLAWSLIIRAQKNLCVICLKKYGKSHSILIG